jgi:hypothetical protein
MTPSEPEVPGICPLTPRHGQLHVGLCQSGLNASTHTAPATTIPTAITLRHLSLTRWAEFSVLLRLPSHGGSTEATATTLFPGTHCH